MNRADCDANRVLKLQAEVERLEAEAAAMRLALAEIKEEAETDLDRDIILTACQSALRGEAGRALLERLRQAEGERDEARAAFDALARAGEAPAGNVARERR